MTGKHPLGLYGLLRPNKPCKKGGPEHAYKVLTNESLRSEEEKNVLKLDSEFNLKEGFQRVIEIEIYAP